MELHSYAKRRVAKKWSTEQKRKLVETRISYDGLFSQKPTASVAPWKKIMSIAKLDDYNVFFVRKQWSNMVAKYKQYKQSRLGNIPTKAIDGEMIRKITHEWEFFEPIHRFMTHKTTNLHSYALPTTQLNKADIKPTQTPVPQLQNTNSNSSTERANLFSSDTNEDFTSAHLQDDGKTPNTDHDFYTKKSAQQLSYFADVSDDTQESLLQLEVPTAKAATLNGQETELLHKELIVGDQIVEVKIEQQSEAGEQQEVTPAAVCYTELNGGTNNGTAKAQRAAQRNHQPHSLSERDKYYRHKRRFNRRLERRFDSILNVFGQIVKAEYPSIDVSPLLGATVTAGVAVVNRLFKSENDDSAEEEQSTTDAEMQMSSAEEREAGEGVKQPQQRNSTTKSK